MSDSLRGSLLVAAPNLVDPNFARSVVFLCEHNADGALGLIVNRPSETLLEDVLPGLDGAERYVEPIRVQGLCLTCHGASLPAPVAARIAELYPEDQAVGFAEGDLRGLFWAEFPAR